jgi:hypothetical protein
MGGELMTVGELTKKLQELSYIKAQIVDLREFHKPEPHQFGDDESYKADLQIWENDLNTLESNYFKIYYEVIK